MRLFDSLIAFHPLPFHLLAYSTSILRDGLTRQLEAKWKKSLAHLFFRFCVWFWFVVCVLFGFTHHQNSPGR
jgi:hypothetical protein